MKTWGKEFNDKVFKVWCKFFYEKVRVKVIIFMNEWKILSIYYSLFGVTEFSVAISIL